MKLKRTNANAGSSVISIQVQDPWRQSGRNQNGGNDLWKRWVL